MGEEKDPFFIQWHLTNRCNLRCKHCYQGNEYYTDGFKLDEAISLVEQLEKTFDKWDVSGELSITGGEPTLWEGLPELINRIGDSKSIKYLGVLTNGINVPVEVMDALVNVGATVQVSIDGINEKKHDAIRGNGTFKKTINSVKEMVSLGIPIEVHYVIHKKSMPVSKEFFYFLKNLGVSRVNFSRLVPIGSADNTMLLSKKELFDFYSFLEDISNDPEFANFIISQTRPPWAIFGKESKCPVGLQTLTILEDGTCVPCRRLPVPIGNIKESSLIEIWYTSQVLWDLRERRNINECGECNLLDKCGGARCIAYAVTGDYMERDPQCWKYEF